MIAPIAASLVGSFVLSLLLVPLVRGAFRRWGIVDAPGHRKIHTAPTPYGGGAAMMAALLLTLGAGLAVVCLRGAPQLDALPGVDVLRTHADGVFDRLDDLAILLAAAVALAMLGHVDDVRRLPAWPKLVVQIFAASAVVWLLDVRATFFVPVAWVNAAATVVWIVAVTNAFNFIDNMDGLSAGVAAIALAVLVGVTAAAGQVFVPVLASALLGAVLGFLRYNFPPASVFMGDAGSLPLGFLVAVLTVMANYYRGGEASRFSPFMPLVLLAVPLYDLVSVTAIRIARGQNPMQADTSHFSHRLVGLGLSRRAAVLAIYAATAATALGALMLRRATTVEAVLVFAQMLCILAVVAILESRLRRADHTDS